jgi:hypothetical protein
MTKSYYILRFEHSDALHKSGDRLYNAQEALYIGQTADCQVLLGNETQYEDAVYAVIVPRRDGEGWNIIRNTPYQEQEVRVNGVAIDYVHHLADGDRIAFANQRQELLFTVREDDDYQHAGIVLANRSVSRWLIAAAIIVPVLLFVGLFTYIEYNKDKKQLTDDMLADAKLSVFQLMTDSVQLVAIDPAQHDTVVLGSTVWGVAGTAFLTADSLLVTARHCIEPWLNIADSLKLDTAHVEPLPVRWALQAETHNTLEDDGTVWELICYCSIIRQDSTAQHIASVRSIDFVMEKDRDAVIELGDFEHLYYWRSITAKPRRVDMMLDDFAYMPVTTAIMEHPQGTIRLGRRQQLRQLCEQNNKTLTIVGFPESENVGAKDAEQSRDELKHRLLFDDEGFPTTVLGHNGQIGHGYSGGPVLWRDGSDWYAVGIVSVTDKKNKNRTYSVPVTEIERKKQKKEQ